MTKSIPTLVMHQKTLLTTTSLFAPCDDDEYVVVLVVLDSVSILLLLDTGELGWSRGGELCWAGNNEREHCSVVEKHWDGSH